MSPPRPLPRYSSQNSSKHSLTASAKNRLSIIAEDGDVPPVPKAPIKAHHRPFNRRWNLGDPPRHSFEKSPPPYSVWNLTGPKGEKLTDVRNNKHIARRGGWKRLLALAVVLIAVVVALAVGLAIGLRKKRNSRYSFDAHHCAILDSLTILDSSASPPLIPPNSTTTTPPDGPFPIGSYAITTFLDTVTTNCTSNPATWRCAPYTTYTDSPSAALASFNWIISAATSSGANYTISSSDNIFSIDFVDVPMTLVDANTTMERYTFTIPLNKTVNPLVPITTDNSQAACMYYNTDFQGNLYTKITHSYPTTTSNTSTVSAGDVVGFEPWPYAADITQKIGGGSSVPDCYKTFNNNLGDRITDGFSAEPSEDTCSCIWKNYDP